MGTLIFHYDSHLNDSMYSIYIEISFSRLFKINVVLNMNIIRFVLFLEVRRFVYKLDEYVSHFCNSLIHQQIRLLEINDPIRHL